MKTVLIIGPQNVEELLQGYISKQLSLSSEQSATELMVMRDDPGSPTSVTDDLLTFANNTTSKPGAFVEIVWLICSCMPCVRERRKLYGALRYLCVHHKACITLALHEVDGSGAVKQWANLLTAHVCTLDQILEYEIPLWSGSLRIYNQSKSLARSVEELPNIRLQAPNMNSLEKLFASNNSSCDMSWLLQLSLGHFVQLTAIVKKSDLPCFCITGDFVDLYVADGSVKTDATISILQELKHNTQMAYLLQLPFCSNSEATESTSKALSQINLTFEHWLDELIHLQTDSSVCPIQERLSYSEYIHLVCVWDTVHRTYRAYRLLSPGDLTTTATSSSKQDHFPVFGDGVHLCADLPSKIHQAQLTHVQKYLMQISVVVKTYGDLSIPEEHIQCLAPQLQQIHNQVLKSVQDKCRWKHSRSAQPSQISDKDKENKLQRILLRDEWQVSDLLHAPKISRISVVTNSQRTFDDAMKLTPGQMDDLLIGCLEKTLRLGSDNVTFSGVSATDQAIALIPWPECLEHSHFDIYYNKDSASETVQDEANAMITALKSTEMLTVFSQMYPRSSTTVRVRKISDHVTRGSRTSTYPPAVSNHKMSYPANKKRKRSERSSVENKRKISNAPERSPDIIKRKVLQLRQVNAKERKGTFTPQTTPLVEKTLGEIATESQRFTEQEISAKDPKLPRDCEHVSNLPKQTMSRSQRHKQKLEEVVHQVLKTNELCNTDNPKLYEACFKRLYDVTFSFVKDLRNYVSLRIEMEKLAQAHCPTVINFEKINGNTNKS